MLYLIYFFSIILVFAFQTSALPKILPSDTLPDLALLCAFYFGLKMKEQSGVALATLIGFFQDCLSGGILGINTLSKGITGFLAAFLKYIIPMNNVFPLGVCITIVSLLDGIIFYLITSLFAKREIVQDSLFHSLPTFIFMNLISASILFPIINKLSRKFGEKPQSTFTFDQ